MESKCPDETLRMRGMNLNLCLLYMFEDTFSVIYKKRKHHLCVCVGGGGGGVGIYKKRKHHLGPPNDVSFSYR